MDTPARNVAKWVVNAIVAAKAADIAADAITGYTRFDADSLVNRLGAGAVGVVVSSAIDPLTDKIVDKTADFIVTQRAKRRAKKDAQKEEK